MAAIKDVLNKFKAAGVDLAAIVSIDGMQIESYSRGNLDVDALCAIATTGLRISEALGREMERGNAKQTVLEYEGGAIVLEPLNDEAMMLVVSADPKSIGRIRYMSKKYHQELIDALDGNGTL
ncbi:MAG: roadblock/LC7 domain-containing protein [Chloroflexota bacterium]|nr:roadblock/LC7 domain-containing protein [Chloroflexota bacterium]